MTTNAPEVPRSAINSTISNWASARGASLPSLALRFSERKLLLVLFDLLMVNLSLFITLTTRSLSDSLLGTILERLPWFLLLSALWIAIGVMLNIYDLACAARVSTSLWAVSGAANITGLIYLFIPYVTPTLPRHRFQLLLFPLLATASVGLWRIFYARVFAQPIFHQKALIVGAGTSGRLLAGVIAKLGVGNGSLPQAAGYRLLGFVDDHISEGSLVDGLRVLGRSHDLVRFAREMRPDEIIIALGEHERPYAGLHQAALDCREMGIPLTTMETLYERLTGRVPLDPVYCQLSTVFPLSQSTINRFYLILRRLVDILAGLAGCVQLLLFIPLVWTAHRICSPGPLFYRQERVGKSGTKFTLIKFRSMVVNAESATGPVWASESDKRITTVGRFLRRTRLDELPQFWNVLKGEMSLIGPRPERPEFISELSQQIPYYRARHAIKPGITGWAQVKYNYGSSVEDARVKLEYDLYYIKYQGPYLDLLILLKTIQVVLGFKGR